MAENIADVLEQKLADDPNMQGQIQELQQEAADLDVELAGMSNAVNAAAVEAISSIEPDDATAMVEQAQDIIDREQHAEIHRERADEIEALRAEAVDDGDFQTARELSAEAEYHLDVASELSSNPSAELVEAQHDTEAETAALDYADYHQDIADSNADAAAAYAGSGDMDTASQYADTAADGYESAGTYADAGGGAVASTSYDSYDSSSADTTATE